MAQPPLAYAEGYAKARLWDQLQADNYIKHTAIGDAVLDPVMEELSSLPPADLHRFILIWFLKSLRLGLVSLVPNFIPAAMSFGLWGYLVGQVGLAGSVMTAIAFGLIVDDTTHFLSKYQKARREGLSAPEAVRSTFRTVGQRYGPRRWSWRQASWYTPHRDSKSVGRSV